MGNGLRGLAAGLLYAAALAGGSLGTAPSAIADDSCLVSIHDSGGSPISNGGSVCQNASGTSCTFNLQACVNDVLAGCSPDTSKKKKIHATGHCGAIGKLQVGAAAGPSCGNTAGIKVHTKKHGKKAGTCNIRIAVKTKGGRSDLDKITLTCNPSSSPCPTTTTSSSSTTTTSLPCRAPTTPLTPGPCPGGCAAAQIVTTTEAGKLVVSGIPAFPFPPGVNTTINTGPALNGCKHDAIIPAGGFTVPVFCIPALMFTSSVTSLHCAAGGSDGNGAVWDASGPAAMPDADVCRVGDTSDGTCNPTGMPCNVGPGGAGNNSMGNINTQRGDGVVDGAGVHTQLDIPVDSLTWTAADATCPDADGMFDPVKGDVAITHFQFILSPTTATANAVFADLNGDSCSRAGAGPDSTRRCINDASQPCGANSDCGTAAGSCVPGAIHGSPATGPCCVVGQRTTVVATGVAFTGGSPLFDLIFSNMSPTSITACNPAPPLGSCTLTNDPCQD